MLVKNGLKICVAFTHRNVLISPRILILFLLFSMFIIFVYSTNYCVLFSLAPIPAFLCFRRRRRSGGAEGTLQVHHRRARPNIHGDVWLLSEMNINILHSQILNKLFFCCLRLIILSYYDCCNTFYTSIANKIFRNVVR